MTPDALRSIRKRNNIGRAAMSKRIGASVDTIRRWETGRSKIPKVAEILILLVYKHWIGEKLQVKSVTPGGVTVEWQNKTMKNNAKVCIFKICHPTAPFSRNLPTESHYRPL
jgi:transcriptional regulator with XRE-family HTH domain